MALFRYNINAEGVGKIMKKELPKIEHYSGEEMPTFGYELFRSVLIPELLGEDIGAILYWSGRKLARQYPFNTMEDVIIFFEKAGWGQLVQIDEGRGKTHFELSSELITARLVDNPNATFTLESGFLAEQLQNIKGYNTESYTEIKNGRNKKVTFLIKWDIKDPVETVTY
jgi:predicted hydrocarbon binding protein